MMEKLERDGMVAVLVSYGYGAGWSTWGNSTEREFYAMDKGLVELAMQKAKEEHVKTYIEAAGYTEPYMGGWPCSIEWIPKGTAFVIEEYDGSESIRTAANLWMTA